MRSFQLFKQSFCSSCFDSYGAFSPISLLVSPLLHIFFYFVFYRHNVCFSVLLTENILPVVLLSWLEIRLPYMYYGDFRRQFIGSKEKDTQEDIGTIKSRGWIQESTLWRASQIHMCGQVRTTCFVRTDQLAPRLLCELTEVDNDFQDLGTI